MKDSLFIITITCALLITWRVYAQEAIADKMEVYLQSAHVTGRFSGVALVQHNGQILFKNAYGYADEESGIRNTIDTKYPILSMTKSFTGALIVKLQEQGLLSVRDQVSEYIPGVDIFEKIQIHHLLTHSSGLHDYTSSAGLEDTTVINRPIPKERILNRIVSKPLEFEPGRRFSYNNSGYFLLGLIIEKVTKKTYETVVSETIFEPFGMHESGFNYRGLPANEKARGYFSWHDSKKVAINHYDSTYAYSAGSIYSTVHDLNRWAEGIRNKKLLNEKGWKMAFNKGYGWIQGEFLGLHYVRHSGGYPGFMSEFVYYPDQDLFIILLNNFGNYDQNIFSISMGLTCIALDKPYDLWQPLGNAVVSPDVLKKYVGEYDNIRFYLAEDGVLRAVIGGSLDLPLYANDEHNFQFESFNTRFQFHQDPNGITTHVTIREHGQQFDLKRK